MNVVLFLGAGFSAPFGLPVMNEFMSHAQDSVKLRDDEKEFLRQIQLDYRRSRSHLQGTLTNLEDMLSLAIMKDRLATAEESAEWSERLKRILRKVLTSYDGGGDGEYAMPAWYVAAALLPCSREDAPWGSAPPWSDGQTIWVP